jgi:uncharacterized protein (TIGR00304 family)
LPDNTIFTIGLLLVLVGFAVGILALVIAILRSARGTGKAKGGGLVMIGPVPIIFGADRESTKILMLLGIVLMVLFVVLSLLPILWR